MGSKKYRNLEKRQAKAEARANHTPTFVTNTFWDDAKDLYEKSMSAIEQTHGQLARFLRTLVADPASVELITDKAGLANNINLLSRDINEHSQRLASIYALHSDKVGGTVTPDEHMAVIQIHGQYHDALEVYDSTIMPTVTHIFEQIGAIEEYLLAQQQAQAQSADVVTDVTVTQTVTQEESAAHV